jgi:Endonuclease-reverse transcriptase
MAVHPTLKIASVNMRKRNAVTHALLNSSNSHLILIQEPWFDTIGTARKDSARQGVDILGGVASPAWEIIYPHTTEGQRPRVMAYARKQTQNDPNAPTFTIVPRPDICAHPSIQVLEVIMDNECWQVVNVYHDVRDNTCLQALLNLNINATTPTLITGDFNTHSPTWSPPDTPRSHWANRIEEWAATNLLTLANNPGEITRRGADHERDSVIDLAWYNEAAIQAASFTDLRIDWAGSLGSDHAMLHFTGCTREASAARNTEPNPGFLIDPEKREEWIPAFKARSAFPAFHHIPSIDEIEAEAAALTEDIHQTNTEVLRKRRPHHPKASPWWNATCAIATQNLHNTHGPARCIAHARLKSTVRVAKRRWADSYIEKAQLWDVATWRHGCRLSKVLSLKGPDGLVHSHEQVADILSQRFFSQTPLQVNAHFEDDPPPMPNPRATKNR